MNKKTLLASAVLLALLSGCTDKNAAEHYQQAQSYLAEQNASAAIIELKSAIQQQPEVAEYRLALGLIYLTNGSSLAAEKELARALQYGSPQELAMLPWVRSLYLSAQFEKILSLNDVNLTEEHNDYVTAYKALAELELGDTDAAMLLFDTLSTSSEPHLISFAQANLALRSQQLDTAIDLFASIPATNLIYPEALYISASIEIARNNTLQAIELFQQYLQLSPKSLRATLLLAQSQVKEQLYEDAEINLQFLLKQLPDQPVANYLKAVIELEKKNFVLAKEHAEKAINNGYKTPQARIIAAIAATNQNLETQALHHLSAVKTHLHIYPPAQKLYTMLQLKSGEAHEAQTMLLDMNQAEQDLQLVAATSFELVKQGDTDAARELLSKYEQQFNLDAQSLASMGVVKLDIPGQELAAVRDLEQALLLDPTQDKTRLLLASSYLRLKQTDKAREMAQALIAKPETAVVGYNLDAFIALQEKNLPLAKAQISKANELAPDNPFGLLMRSAISTDEQDFATAASLLETSVSKYPQYSPAIVQYYRLKRSQNEGASAISTVAKVQQMHPENVELSLQLAQLQYAEGQYKQAAELFTQRIEQGQDLSSQRWLYMIDALYRDGQSSAAQKYSQQWHVKYPNDVQAGITYAKALTQQKELQRAFDVVNTLSRQHTGNKALMTIKMLLLTELKQYKQALELLEKLPAEQANSAEMLLQKGRLQQQTGQLTPALNTFLESYQLKPDSITAMFIANIYATDRSHKQAVQFLESHFAQHKADQTLSVYYANLMMDVDSSKAIQLYADLLVDTPESVMLLNNYAWLLSEANELNKAQDYAAKALKQAPDNPDVLDTYGKILLKMQQGTEAVGYFEKSLQIRPNSNQVSIHYAEALITTGDKAKAKQILLGIESNDYSEKKRRDELLAQTQI
mgnify:CR=1 FL=1